MNQVPTRRVHILGASGAGVTTTGRALADRLAVPHHDTDDYFFLPTDPPFRDKRAAADRLRLMDELFIGRGAWVLSGSLIDWGDPLIPHFDLVVYLTVAIDVRVARLREREVRRFGTAVAPGGWRHEEMLEFLDWASHYDDGNCEGRSRSRHEAWLAKLSCPVLRADGTRPTAELVAEIVAHLPPLDDTSDGSQSVVTE